jgi:signal transduction histidine kinase
LLALIDGLLDVAKIEAGRYELREEKLDLNTVVERAVRTVQPVAARKEQRIELALPTPPVAILADEKALHQILLNLLSNAIKFSHWRGLVQVRVGATLNGVAIMVEDHGIGIPDDKLAHVGKPFFQAHEGTARVAGGTGIGLSVTRALIERLGGALSIASRHGIGTCVTVVLPAFRVLPDTGKTTAA